MLFYTYLWYFVIYSCLGWCAEVAFHTVTCGGFANRGFLNGPVCPIYGFGAVLVIMCLTPFSNNIFVLFFAAAAITSALELLTGYVLHKVFHSKWWDYSEYPFNIGGYICLKFSILWGIVCTILMRTLQPTVARLIVVLPIKLGIVILCILGACYLADAIVTVISLRSLALKLRGIEEIADRLKKLSDEVGVHISDGITDVLEKKKELTELGKDKYDELAELTEKYREKLAEWHFGHKRILLAFPSLKSVKHHFSIEKLKEYMKLK